MTKRTSARTRKPRRARKNISGCGKWPVKPGVASARCGAIRRRASCQSRLRTATTPIGCGRKFLLSCNNWSKNAATRKFMINTIYKPNGSRIWRWKFRQQPADGKIEDVSLGTSEKQVAEKRRAELLRERQFERDGLILPKSLRDAAQRNLTD